MKDAKIPLILPTTEKEIDYIKKTAPSVKRVYPCTPDRRPVAMVSPITKTVTKLPESSKVNKTALAHNKCRLFDPFALRKIKII